MHRLVREAFSTHRILSDAEYVLRRRGGKYGARSNGRIRAPVVTIACEVTDLRESCQFCSAQGSRSRCFTSCSQPLTYLVCWHFNCPAELQAGTLFPKNANPSRGGDAKPRGRIAAYSRV